MTEIIRQIAAVGIPADQMRTTGVELNPQRRPGPGNGQITGYTATNRIVVTVNDLRLTGRVIDAGVGAGANEVAGISFGLRDAKTDQTRALRLAVQNAKDTATILAQAAGVGPLRLVRLEVLGETAPTPRIAFAAAQASRRRCSRAWSRSRPACARSTRSRERGSTTKARLRTGGPRRARTTGRPRVYRRAAANTVVGAVCPGATDVVATTARSAW